MRTRVITAIVALCILFPTLLLSDTWFFPVVIAGCSVIALWEIFRCIGVVKNLWVTIPIYLASTFIIISYRLFCQKYSFSTADFISYAAVPCAIIVLLYLFAAMVFSRGKITVEDVAISGFMGAYIVAAFTAILFLRDAENGRYTYLLIFIGAWVSDSFAYFTGRLLGKHKLIPEISPKKTVEGSIGGILFCALSFILYGIVITHFVPNATRMNLGALFLYGVIVSVVSQIGDLCLSAVKRHYGIKDFGKVFPGHGGVLDRFDSILAVSLVLFILNEFASVFKVVGEI